MTDGLTDRQTDRQTERPLAIVLSNIVRRALKRQRAEGNREDAIISLSLRVMANDEQFPILFSSRNCSGEATEHLGSNSNAQLSPRLPRFVQSQ